MKTKLREVREWAEKKIAESSEPPWAWFQYMKLVETIRAMEASTPATISPMNSPQSELRSGAPLVTGATTPAAQLGGVEEQWDPLVGA